MTPFQRAVTSVQAQRSNVNRTVELFRRRKIKLILLTLDQTTSYFQDH